MLIRCIFLILLLPATSFSDSSNQLIYPFDSKSRIEENIVTILKNDLSLPAKLESLNSKEDKRVSIYFKGKNEEGIASVGVFIDTKIFNKNNRGNVTAQVLSIYSVSNISLKKGHREELLKWINDWNNKVLPFKLHMVKDKLYVSINLLMTPEAPVTKNQFIASFRAVTQVWAILIQDLKKNSLI